MALLKPRGSAAAAARPRADVRIRVRASGGAHQLVVASGHLDEVQELALGGTKLGGGPAADPSGGREGEGLTLVEAGLLGEGAFSRVSEVTEATTNRTFALKRMAKTAALQCPEHVYCEQHISKNTANAFCIRQYASFKVVDLCWVELCAAAGAGAYQRLQMPPAQRSTAPATHTPSTPPPPPPPTPPGPPPPVLSV